MLAWFLFGFMFMGLAIWFLFENDKNFEKEELTEKSAMNHDMKTVGGLFFVVLGGYIVIIFGIGLFLRFMFTPW